MWTSRQAPVIAVSAMLLVAGCASRVEAASGPQFALHGVVLAAPMCPVEREGHPCPPGPVGGATVRARPTGSAARAASVTTTDGRGRFRFVLPPGRYVIRVTAAGTALPDEQSSLRVTVPRTTGVRLVVDSGIR